MTNRLVSYWKLHRLPILMILFSALFYFAFGYDLVRTDMIKLVTLFAALLFFCFKLIQPFLLIQLQIVISKMNLK